MGFWKRKNEVDSFALIFGCKSENEVEKKAEWKQLLWFSFSYVKAVMGKLQHGSHKRPVERCNSKNLY